MTEERPLLAIVPARGGSRGVPRKSMRTLGGRPLIAHALATVSESGVADKLFFSSDDPEMLRWATLHGYEAGRRPAELAEPATTISELAAYLADELDWRGDVGVFQPTSPFLSPDTVRRAVETFRSAGVDSLASVVRERHLFWYCEDGDALASARPLFNKRANRQFADHPVLRETGGIQLARADPLRATRQIVTSDHLPFLVPDDEGLDIDTSDDLIAARSRMARATVVFRLRANREVGSGHLHHCLQLADELADHDLHFLLRDCDPFVGEQLERAGYEPREEGDLRSDLRELAGPGANLVVNDVLDTSEEEILAERAAGFRVVNVEDLGAGARFADWVVNALYPVRDGAVAHASWGGQFATLRSEFLGLPPKRTRELPERILITFGGADRGGLAARSARLLSGEVDQHVRVVVGPGASTDGFPDGVDVISGEVSMADELMAADLAITSAGRTVYEAAATGTPVVVLAANAREATHAHLGYESGVVFLGIGSLVHDDQIVETVKRLLADPGLRTELSTRLRASIDNNGAARIGHRIRAILAGL
jgi:CMP-N-acetylneuraminic acid synthetase/spore coat polysaccharide biosynthesis predicted glycosyltransferase SpsG